MLFMGVSRPPSHVNMSSPMLNPNPKKVELFTGPPLTRPVKAAGKEICQVSNDGMVMTGHRTVSDQHVSQRVFPIAR